MLDEYQEDNENLQGSGGRDDDASSCSFEDIDTEVIREMELSKMTKTPNDH